MAYTRAPFINMNPALLGPQQPAFALQPINPVEAQPVPAQPAPAVVQPALPPQARDGGGFGEIALKALQMFQNQQQQQQAPGYLGAPTGGAVAGLGLKGVMGLQENRLRENMANAQLAQQRQRDLMQAHQQEQARADQIAYQQTKFKNDMDLRKMEEQQKKADRQAEMQSPEYILKKTKAELELKQIQETGIQPDIEWNQALAYVKAGADPKQVAATFKIPNEAIFGGVAERSQAAFNKSMSRGSGGGGKQKYELDGLTQGQWNLIYDHPEAAAGFGISPQGVATIKASGKIGASSNGSGQDEIGVTQYKTITDAMTALEADIAKNTPKPKQEGYIWDTPAEPDTPEMKATRDALQKKLDILDKRKNQFLYGTPEPTGSTTPTPAPAAQTALPEIQQAYPGAKVVTQNGNKVRIQLADGTFKNIVVE